MTFIPKAQEIYKHFKGNLYQVLTVAEHTETGESLVIYQALYGEFKIYARPLAMFTSKVDKEKYKEVVQEYRFQLYDFSVMHHKIDFKEEVSYKEESIVKSDEEELVELDPLLLEFLDATTHEERMNILTSLRHRITDEMINIMAVTLDVEINEGPIENRYDELRMCLLTRKRFEIQRSF